MDALPPAADIARAPLVPVALAVTAGILLDRALVLPLPFSAAVLLIALAAFLIERRHPDRAVLLLWLAFAALGAFHHRQHHDLVPADDVSHLATEEPRLLRLRGQFASEPVVVRQTHNDPLRTLDRPDPTQTVLSVTHVRDRDDWLPASGRVRLTVAGPLAGLHAGDVVEVLGWLSVPSPPGNPGERDGAEAFLDQGIRARLEVRKTPGTVTRLEEGWSGSLRGWLAMLRGWGQRTLLAELPPDLASVATALLLGDGNTLTAADWEKHQRTGVIHILVISGQQLVVLAAFFWVVVRLCGLRRKRAALFVGLFLFAYAVLTGGHPPVLRAAVTVAAGCGALLLRRPVLRANALALAWLVVLALNPADMADVGCQLSFLCVALMTWGTGHWFAPKPTDPLEQLIDESRPAIVRVLRRLGRVVAVTYGVSLVLGLATLPLVAARYHTVAPIGMLIGPPVIALAAVALVAGFLMLAASAVAHWLAAPFVVLTRWSLAGCEELVDLADGLPGGHGYVGSVPGWWLAVFYGGMLTALWLPAVRRRGRWVGLAGLGWVCLGLSAGALRPAPDELRVTFLAVGHGGCTVLETPDGRTLLYDAGALAGPDVTRRQIAPFLWQRGVRRVDEVLLSHADLDHFNGLPSLLERFAVGQVTWTPTFADKSTPGVKAVLAELERRGVRTRIVQSGDRLTAGDVEIEVLHPPAAGPAGVENVRSMVLRVRHLGHSLLLTGDLEAAGLERVLAQPAEPVDVLQAPHHGGKTANPPALAAWCRPKLVVSCEGLPRGTSKVSEVYEAKGAKYLGTYPHGAVTLHSHRTGLVVETYRTGQRFVLRRGE